MPKIERADDIYSHDNAIKYYEVFGKNVEDKRGSEANRLIEDLIPQNLQNKTVLDLGCGNGCYSELFCQRGAKRVVAMDLKEPMIDQAQKRKEEKQLDQLELVQADLEDLPFGQDKFDFIFSRFSLIHSPKMEQAVSDLSKTLSGKGEVLIETNVAEIENPEQCADIKKEPINLILSIGEKQVPMKNFVYTMEDYTKAFLKAGLRVERQEQFPADGLLIDPEYPHKDKVKFTYGIFKLIKEDEPSQLKIN